MTRLKEIHELFKGKIFRSPLDEWTKHATLLDTDPQHTGLAHTDNLMNEVNHRPFVVDYKLMNISRQQKNLLVYAIFRIILSFFTRLVHIETS